MQLRDSEWVKHKDGEEKRVQKETRWEVSHIPGNALRGTYLLRNEGESHRKLRNAKTCEVF